MIYQTQLVFIANLIKAVISATALSLSALLALTFVLENIELQLTDPNNATTIFNLLNTIANSNGTSGHVTIPTESYIAEDGQTNPDINLQALVELMNMPNIEEASGIIEVQTGELTAAIEAAAVEAVAAIEEAAAVAVGGIDAATTIQTAALITGLAGPHDPLNPFTTTGDIDHYIKIGNDHLEVIRSGTDRISGTNERIDYTNAILQELDYKVYLVNITEAIVNNTDVLKQIERDSNLIVQQNDATLQTLNAISAKMDTIIGKLTNIDVSTKLKPEECVPGFSCTLAAQIIASQTYYLNTALSFIDPVLLQNSYNICNNETC